MLFVFLRLVSFIALLPSFQYFLLISFRSSSIASTSIFFLFNPLNLYDFLVLFDLLDPFDSSILFLLNLYDIFKIRINFSNSYILKKYIRLSFFIIIIACFVFRITGNRRHRLFDHRSFVVDQDFKKRIDA